jgi:hypothetical protein
MTDFLVVLNSRSVSFFLWCILRKCSSLSFVSPSCVLSRFAQISLEFTPQQSFMSAGSLTLGGNMSLAIGPLGRNSEAAGALNTNGKIAAMQADNCLQNHARLDSLN